MFHKVLSNYTIQDMGETGGDTYMQTTRDLKTLEESIRSYQDRD